MSSLTSHYNMVKPALTDVPPDITVLNPNFDTMDTELYKINQLLNSGAITTPTVALGMNSVIRKTDNVEAIPKFTMQGKAYTNLLGRDGNCEDISKWSNWQSTSALDTTNKVFGANGIKITSSSTAGNIFKVLSTVPMFDATKYYLFSAYVKNGNATGIRITKDSTGGGTVLNSVDITDTSKFVRVGMIAQPSNLNAGNFFSPYVVGTSGQYAYVDGIMANEISATEYANLSVAQLLDKYPYVDSYACLTNPYIEVRHDNLVRNGNGEEGIGWWSMPTGVTLSNSANGFSLVTVGTNKLTRQVVVTKPNTDYYISGNVSGNAQISINNEANSIRIRDGFGAFNSGAETAVSVVAWNALEGTGYFDSIMLVEGVSAPTMYKPCRIERCVVEGKFTSDDSFTLENGEATGLLNWKHRTLFGKDYDIAYGVDYTGYKSISIPGITGLQNLLLSCVKYDGKVLPIVDSAIALPSADNAKYNTANTMTLSVSDTDTGWAETIAPNSDEVKAFMNGWKAVSTYNNRYIAFVSLLDGSVPSGAIKASISATTNTTSLTVSSGGTQFVSGDVVTIVSSAGVSRGAYFVTGTPTATNIPLTGSASVTSGDTVMKADNGTTTSLVTWCKNNIAPNYEGYQLHYKLANPEPITDANVHINGDIPKLDAGDNYLYLDYGMVIGEVPTLNLYSGSYYMNSSTSNAGHSELQSKTNDILAIYRNELWNNSNWTIGANNTGYYGGAYAYILSTLFDINATYTVDYQILKTMHTSPTSIAMAYQQSILAAVEDVASALESKQPKDSALDNLVDLSVYQTRRISGTLWATTNTAYIEFAFDILGMRAAPIITVKEFYCEVSGVVYSSAFKVSSAGVDKAYNMAGVTYATADATVLAAVKAYAGGRAYIKIELDCRGRL